MLRNAGGRLTASDGTDPSVLFLRRFGRRLKLLRSQRGMSQQDLAEAAGFHRTFIGELERGQADEMNVDQLYDLAGSLGLTVHDLLPKDDE